jgi:hypothetical protein
MSTHTHSSTNAVIASPANPNSLGPNRSHSFGRTDLPISDTSANGQLATAVPHFRVVRVFGGSIFPSCSDPRHLGYPWLKARSFRLQPFCVLLRFLAAGASLGLHFFDPIFLTKSGSFTTDLGFISRPLRLLAATPKLAIGNRQSQIFTFSHFGMRKYLISHFIPTFSKEI